MRRAQRCRFGGQQGWQNLAMAGDSTKTAFRSGSDREDRKKSNRLEPSPGRYPIPQAEQLFKIETANVRGRGGRPLVLSLGGCKGGYSLSRKRVSPFLRTLRHAGNKVQSTALPKIPPFGKERRTPLPRRSSYFCESKIYRYFCMPSVARAGSPETEMVNLTPVALLKRSSSFRKSSAAWLHSPPVILNRLSMKMWEIS